MEGYRVAGFVFVMRIATHGENMGTTEDAESTELGFSSAFGGFGVFGGSLVFHCVTNREDAKDSKEGR